MREFTPDIPISTEYLLADRWYKDVDAQPRDRQGRIVPFSANAGQGKSLSSTPRRPRQKSGKTRKGQRRPVYDPDTIWAFILPPEEVK